MAEKDMKDNSIYKYWGKARKLDDGSYDYHLLVYHCLDVAAVGKVWLEYSPFLQRAFHTDENYTKEESIAWILFFVALHDIGKTDLRFQLKVPESIDDFGNRSFLGSGLSLFDCKNYNHGPGGIYWFQKEFESILDIKKEPDEFDDSYRGIFDLFDSQDNKNWSAWKPWIESVCEHHGRKLLAENCTDLDYPSSMRKLMKIRIHDERKKIVHAFEFLFLKPIGLSISDLPPESSKMLSGFCSICDWLGSNSTDEHFSFSCEPVALNEYFNSKHEEAEAILHSTGLITKSKQYQGVKKLLKNESSPRQLQTKVEFLPVQQGLTIVEGPTGSGKTELALAYAWRLLGDNWADSIVFALPSQATSNGMLPRLDKLSGSLFEEHPNLVLAHGNARFNNYFSEIKNRTTSIQGDQDAAAQCCMWLSQSRKRALLGQIAVCTVDQVLMSVLPVRHGFVRQFCSGRSVLIIDEVHAYDQYMYGLLVEVLKNQRACGGSVILLSATLPGFQKEQLLRAWDSPVTEVSSDYPLITNVTTAGVRSIVLREDEYPLDSDMKTVKKQIEFSEKMLPSNELYSRISKAVKEGANVAVICNLVDDAQQIYQSLLSIIDDPSKVQLFHSRYTLKDRQKIEEKVVVQFGEDERRIRGMVLVSTQVIEQSLNVDFDWMITQLCPVDLLFQRIGRLHRFNLRNRSVEFSEAVCTVLAPENNFDFGTHELIYQNKRVLWRTLQLLIEEEEAIRFPFVYRPWVEDVYQEAPWINESQEVTESNKKFQNEIAFIKNLKSKMITESAMNPLDDNHSNAQIMTRDGEMSISIIPFIKSKIGTVLLSGEILEKINRDDKLETIYMNSVSIPYSWWKWMKAFVNEDKENNLWFRMEIGDSEEWERKLPVSVIKYSKKLGLRKESL
ncbi:MAG: CRISPR-associated helicase/endonuclease Cas3 [Spirochaetales bacterium]|uniref:CRISPR-associated helicase/endonuclease Cas3 n=1 Tax=Candidatus Thalassospirochaeta sargassi TaxID=3119039 RepID=A0AAJ1II83_9SPIO|nr:CRISPR-associated helicase/endonuclease Cas3 [Spirochaetales bacterium]